MSSSRPAPHSGLLTLSLVLGARVLGSARRRRSKR
jgi:hypothetical protein